MVLLLSSPAIAHQLSELEARVAALEALLEGVIRQNNAEGPALVFEGMNVQIRNGSGETEHANGLGNLILGYNESPVVFNNGRTGSHNLVIGEGHQYCGVASVFIGEDHLELEGSEGNLYTGSSHLGTGKYNCACGGSENVLNGKWNAVEGGAYNTSYGEWCGVTGGMSNACWGAGWVFGGLNNAAFGAFNIQVGGYLNTVQNGFLGTNIAGDSQTLEFKGDKISRACIARGVSCP